MMWYQHIEYYDKNTEEKKSYISSKSYTQLDSKANSKRVSSADLNADRWKGGSPEGVPECVVIALSLSNQKIGSGLDKGITLFLIRRIQGSTHCLFIYNSITT